MQSLAEALAIPLTDLAVVVMGIAICCIARSPLIRRSEKNAEDESGMAVGRPSGLSSSQWLILAVPVLLTALVVGLDIYDGASHQFLQDHSLTASALGSFLLLLVAVFVFDQIQDHRTQTRAFAALEVERSKWSPLVRPFLDGVLPIISELQAESQLRAIGEQLDAEEDDSPDAIFAREELDMDVENALERGKSLTPGQMPWDGRSEAIGQLLVVQSASKKLGELQATWSSLLDVEPVVRNLLLRLAGALEVQRDALDMATEPNFDVSYLLSAIHASEQALEGATTAFVQEYALRSGRTQRAVETIIRLGEREYFDAKLAARRAVSYYGGPLASRPLPIDPDDEQNLPF